jgi:hypothetical protein
MAIQVCSDLFGNVVDTVQATTVWLTDGPKRVFGDIDATGDLLRMTQSAQKVVETFARIMPLKLIADGISSVVDFFNAKDLIGCVHYLVSGAAAKENAFGPNVPNFLNVAKNLSILVQDVTSFVRWLVSLKLLDEWVTTCTAKIVSWGQSFIVIDGVGDVASITGSLFSIADSLRLIAAEAMEGIYWLDGQLVPSKLIDRCIDLAKDVCWIASTVLNNIPGISALYTNVASTAGSFLSLGKFFKKQYWDTLPGAALASQVNPIGQKNAV